MTTILVTGATGFIGRHTVERLLSEGVSVVSASRRQFEDDRVRSIRSDLTLPDGAATAIRDARPDAIVHLAGLAKGRNDPALMRSTFDANLASAVEVLNAALQHGVPRVVMAGSLDEVFEGDDPCPTSPYAASKTAATMYARLVASHGLEVMNARIFMGFGPHQPSDKLIPTVISDYLRGDVPVIHAPHRSYDWIYVTDIADALAHLAVRIDDRGPRFRQFDVGTGVLTTTESLTHVIADLCGRPPLVEVAQHDSGGRVVRRADPAAMEAIGWTASVPLRDGLERVIDHIARQHRSEVTRP